MSNRMGKNLKTGDHFRTVGKIRLEPKEFVYVTQHQERKESQR